MQAKQAVLDIVQQINDLLAQLEPHQYRNQLPEFDGNSLGQHFRHILEFFQCLEQGIPAGLVDYASRKRNLLYEDNPALAAQAFQDFTETLHEYGDDVALTIKGEFGGADRPVYQSSFGRELLFVYDHAIHHLAIIRIGISCHYPDIRKDKDLGVSPSTIKARKLTS